MAEQGKPRPVIPPPAPEEPTDTSAQERADERTQERERKRADRAASREAAIRAKREQAERDREARLQRASSESDRTTEQPAVAAASAGSASSASSTGSAPVPAQQATRRKQPAAPRRTRKAQLRLVQVDAWSVMKTAFLLSIALGIVLVVAVAIVWSVLGAAGVWDSVNSIVQQAVGSATGPQFDITDYLSTSRVLGVAMVVAALDVVLITAIATLGAFLYNLSAALLGGVEVTLAEDN